MWYIFILLLGVCSNSELKGSDIFNCTQPITKDKGWLVPGNFNRNCTWSIINATTGILVFENFQLLKDESLTLSTGGKVFSGHKMPFSVFLLGNSSVVNITLVSKTTQDIKQRFRAFFSSNECHYDLPTSMTSFSSPVYPVVQNTNCTFHIPESGDAYMLSIVFEQFSLNNSTLLIQGKNIPQQIYSGTLIPPDVFTKENLDLTLQFGKNNTDDNFSISVYNVLKACSGYIQLNDTTQSSEVKGSPQAQQSVMSEAECRSVIESNENTVVGFSFKNSSLLNGFDQLSLNDGPSMHSKTLLLVNSLNQNITTEQYIRSSRNYMFVSFRPFDKQSNFVGVAKMFKSDLHDYSAEGTVSLSRNNAEPHVIFLLDTPDDHKQVFLKVNASNTTLLPGATLSFFSDFEVHSSPIAVLRQDKIYPVISPTSKMMVIADNFTNSSYTAYYQSIRPGCYEMSSKNSGTYSLFGHCNETCSWIINSNATTKDTLALDILKVGDGDKVHIRLLDAYMTSLTSFSSNDTFIPEIYIPASIGAMVTIERSEKCQENETNANFLANYIIKENCNEMHKVQFPKTYQISSPNYPNTYPVLADCWWNLTSSFSAHVLLTFSKLHLAPGHCVDVFTHKNGTNFTQVGNYSNQPQLPDDLFTELNVSLHFKSFPCSNTTNETSIATASGYLLNLTATECGGLYTGSSGNFSTYINRTLCIWMVKVPSDSKAVNIIKFKVLGKNENTHVDLKIYDGSSLRSPVIDNITGEILSRTNTVIFMYKNLTNSASVINITFSAEACNSSSLCENGICLHPDWRCNGIDDCGDYTDEKNCTYIPDHGGSGSNTNNAGVSPVAVGVVIPIIFAAGIICAIGVPYLLRRYRGGRYQQFRDVSVTD